MSVWLLCVPHRVEADMNKFTFQYRGIAFQGQLWRTAGMWRPLQRASLGTLIEEASVLSDYLSWKLTLVESAHESAWVGKMWSQTLRTAWSYQSKSLQHPVWCIITSGYLWKLGKTLYYQTFVLFLLCFLNLKECLLGNSVFSLFCTM